MDIFLLTLVKEYLNNTYGEKCILRNLTYRASAESLSADALLSVCEVHEKGYIKVYISTINDASLVIDLIPSEKYKKV